MIRPVPPRGRPGAARRLPVGFNLQLVAQYHDRLIDHLNVRVIVPVRPCLIAADHGPRMYAQRGRTRLNKRVGGHQNKSSIAVRVRCTARPRSPLGQHACGLRRDAEQLTGFRVG